jgi:hypothetical protein
MHDLLDTAPVLSEVCPRCRSLFNYRRDGSGNLVRELCRTCHPADRKPQPSTLPFIAFTGLALAGKTTCANHLRSRYGYGILTFAAPLKRMLATLVQIHDKDATPYILCGRTVREAMQTLGTEWGRQLIGDDIWLRAAREEVERIQLSGARGIACDDVRFDNEARLVRELGGRVVWLGRPGLKAMEHVSERGINTDLIDYCITAHDGTDLLEKLEGYLARP